MLIVSLGTRPPPSLSLSYHLTLPSSSSAPRSGPPDSVIYTPESTAEALAHPPAKRRRAKRTEEERIEYLKSDPYVSEFEAYRVLCASCDKWIRLRPNSTYCSIPWDAHRKSCLAKKMCLISLSSFHIPSLSVSYSVTIRMFMLLKSGTLSFQRILMSANSTQNVFSATCVING